MQRTLVYLMVILGGGAFLFMVKLMHDMTGHMAQMTDHVAVMSTDMGQMRSHMEVLVEKVAGIETSVGHMESLAADVHGIRENVSEMTGVIHKGGEQMDRFNPMHIMEQMMTPSQQHPSSRPRR